MGSDVSRLISALEDPDAARRSSAAEHLARLGPDACPAAVALVCACGDEAEEVREWAVGALEELGPPAASDADALASLLGHRSPNVAYWAATLLGRLGTKASAAVPALGAAVSEASEKSVRERAAWALGRIGPPATEGIGPLRKAAAGDDPRLARLARRAIEQILGQGE